MISIQNKLNIGDTGFYGGVCVEGSQFRNFTVTGIEVEVTNGGEYISYIDNRGIHFQDRHIGTKYCKNKQEWCDINIMQVLKAILESDFIYNKIGCRNDTELLIQQLKREFGEDFINEKLKEAQNIFLKQIQEKELIFNFLDIDKNKQEYKTLEELREYCERVNPFIILKHKWVWFDKFLGHNFTWEDWVGKMHAYCWSEEKVK